MGKGGPAHNYWGTVRGLTARKLACNERLGTKVVSISHAMQCGWLIGQRETWVGAHRSRGSAPLTHAGCIIMCRIVMAVTSLAWPAHTAWCVELCAGPNPFAAGLGVNSEWLSLYRPNWVEMYPSDEGRVSSSWHLWRRSVLGGGVRLVWIGHHADRQGCPLGPT